MAVSNYVASGSLSISPEAGFQGGLVVEFLATSPRLFSRGHRVKFKSTPIGSQVHPNSFWVNLDFATHFGNAPPRVVQLRLRVPVPGGRDLKSSVAPVHIPQASTGSRYAAVPNQQPQPQEVALLLKADGRAVEAKVMVQLQEASGAEGLGRPFASSSAPPLMQGGHVGGGGFGGLGGGHGDGDGGGCGGGVRGISVDEPDSGPMCSMEQDSAGSNSNAAAGVAAGPAAGWGAGPAGGAPVAGGPGVATTAAHAAAAMPSLHASGTSQQHQQQQLQQQQQQQQQQQRQQQQQLKKRPWWSLSQLLGSFSGRSSSSHRDARAPAPGGSTSVTAKGAATANGAAHGEAHAGLPAPAAFGHGSSSGPAGGAGAPSSNAGPGAGAGVNGRESSFRSSCPFLSLGPTAFDAAAAAAAAAPPRPASTGATGVGLGLHVGAGVGGVPLPGWRGVPEGDLLLASGSGVAAMAISSAAMAGEGHLGVGSVGGVGSFGGSARSNGGEVAHPVHAALQPLARHSHSHAHPYPHPNHPHGPLDRGSAGGIGRFGGPSSAPVSNCSSRAGSQDGSSPLHKKARVNGGPPGVSDGPSVSGGPSGLMQLWSLGRHAKLVVPLAGAGPAGPLLAGAGSAGPPSAGAGSAAPLLAGTGSAGPAAAVAPGLPPLPPKPPGSTRLGVPTSDRGSGVGPGVGGLLGAANESGAGAGQGPGQVPGIGRLGSMDAAQLAFAGLLPSAAGPRTPPLAPHPSIPTPRPPTAAPRTPGRPLSHSARHSLEAPLHGHGQGQGQSALEGRDSIRGSTGNPVALGAVPAHGLPLPATAHGLHGPHGGVQAGTSAAGATAAAGGAPQLFATAGGATAGGATAEGATAGAGTRPSVWHRSGIQSAPQVSRAASSSGWASQNGDGEGDGPQGDRDPASMAADEADGRNPATPATATTAATAGLEPAQGQGLLLELPALPVPCHASAADRSSDAMQISDSLLLTAPGGAGVGVAGAEFAGAVAATSAAAATALERGGAEVGAHAAGASTAAVPGASGAAAGVGAGVGEGVGISGALRQEIADVINSLQEQLQGLGPGGMPTVSPRRTEFKESLEALLKCELADESVARATLDSVVMEITPFNRGRPLGDGWYAKDLLIRDPTAADGSGGMKRINSCPGIAEAARTAGAGAGAGGGAAAAAAAAPVQKTGFVAAMARVLRGAHRHTQSAAIPSSLDVLEVPPPSVAVQALYAPVDQVSERGQTACTCIALEVAAWLEQHPCQPGPGRSCRMTAATLSDLVKRGCNLWRTTCWPEAGTGIGVGGGESIGDGGMAVCSGGGGGDATPMRGDLAGLGIEAWPGMEGGCWQEGERAEAGPGAADNLLGFHAALEARNKRQQQRAQQQQQPQQQQQQGHGGGRTGGRPPLFPDPHLRPGSQPGNNSSNNSNNSNNSNSSANCRLYEACSAYSQVGPRGMSDPATTLPDFCSSAASAAAAAAAPLTFVLTASGHSTAASFLPDGRVVYINSLGRSLAPSCRHAHVLEFASVEGFCAVYAGLTAPAGVEPAQVEAHRVALQPPPGGEPDIQLFMPQG